GAHFQWAVGVSPNSLLTRSQHPKPDKSDKTRQPLKIRGPRHEKPDNCREMGCSDERESTLDLLTSTRNLNANPLKCVSNCVQLCPALSSFVQLCPALSSFVRFCPVLGRDNWGCPPTCFFPSWEPTCRWPGYGLRKLWFCIHSEIGRAHV